MRASDQESQAVRLTEDVIRAHPEGAPTRVVLERLLRAGVGLPQACEALLGLERARRVASDGERWRLRTP